MKRRIEKTAEAISEHELLSNEPNIYLDHHGSNEKTKWQIISIKYMNYILMDTTNDFFFSHKDVEI